ncbi:MAG: hypothetical protein ACTS5G_01250, partial [Burkholderiales bacterium]
TEANAELKLAEGGAWSAPEMLKMGFSRAQLARCRRQFRIVYWQDRLGGYHYPKWQFDPAMVVLPAVAEILGVFRTHDTMRVLSWFVQAVAPGRKSLLELIRAGRNERAVALVREAERLDASVPELSKEEEAELGRRWSDLEDPTRYVVLVCWTRKSALYFDVAEGTYVMAEITETCLFRRREHAEAVARQLDGRRRRGVMNHRVVAVKKTRMGIRILEALPDPWEPGKHFKPRLKQRSPQALPPLVPIAPLGTRGHIVDSFLFVLEHRDGVAAIIQDAPTRAEAQRSLVRMCRMSSAQANAVLELRLWQFTDAARGKWEAELKRLVRQPKVNRLS